MGRKRRNEIKSSFPDMGKDKDLVFNLAYWINWYLNRETEMIRKGMERYLADEKLAKYYLDKDLAETNKRMWVYDPPTPIHFRPSK